MLFRDWSTSYLAAGSLWPAGVSAAVFDVKKDLVIPDDQIYNCAYDTVNIFSQSIRSTTTVTRLPVCPASQTETVTQTVTITAPSQSIDNANEDMIIPAKTGSSSPDLPWYSMIPAYFNQYTDADSQHPEDTAIDTILAPEYLDQDTDADTQFPDTAIDAIMAPAEPNVNYSRYPCPLSLAIDYTLKSDNSSWQLFCNTDLYYHDLRAHNATNLAVCMQECIKLNKLVASNPRAYGTQYCIAVTYTTWAAGLNANCYLKHAVTTAIYQAYKFDSAKLASFDLPNALAVSVYSNRPTATVPPPATSIPPAPYQPASPCPYPNKSYYKFANRTNPRISNIYQLYCDTVYYYNDLPGLYTNNFDDCIAACDQWTPIVNPDYDISVHQPCIAITYHQYIPRNNATVTPNCHRKYAISATANGVRPAVVAATRVDSSVAASLVITATYSVPPPKVTS